MRQRKHRRIAGPPGGGEIDVGDAGQDVRVPRRRDRERRARGGGAEAPSAATTAPASAPGARPLYYDRPIEDADLEGRTLRELALLRNTIYARAGRTFRKDWLEAYFTTQPWYRPVAVEDPAKITALDRDNANLIASFDAALDRPALVASRDEVLARVKAGTATPEDGIELRLLSARLGEWIAGDATPEATRSPLEDPSTLDRMLTVMQLSDLSRRDLRLLRNTIYARKGRPFKSEVLNAYFSTVSWYAADATYTDDRLSAVDKKNVRLIRSVEDSLGGPIGEHEHKEADGWFAEG